MMEENPVWLALDEIHVSNLLYFLVLSESDNSAMLHDALTLHTYRIP